MASPAHTYRQIAEDHSRKRMSEWVRRFKFFSEYETEILKKVKVGLIVLSLISTGFGYVFMSEAVHAFVNSSEINVIALLISAACAWVVGKSDSAVRAITIDLQFRKLINADKLSKKELAIAYIETSIEHCGQPYTEFE